MRHFALAICAMLFVGVARGEESICVRVVSQDGKPVVAAKVWVCPGANDEDIAEPPAVLTDQAGIIRIPQSDGGRVRYIFVHDAAGRIGYHLLRPPYAESQEDQDFVITLLPITERA